MQTALGRCGLTVAAFVLGSTLAAAAQTAAANPPPVVAQASPAPAPTATPSPFTYGGYFRGFLFNRQNASAYPKGQGQINQQSFNSAISVHGQYAFGTTGLLVGATYLYGNPLGANGVCDDPANYGQGGGCQQYPTSSKQFKQQDTTLPPYTLSTLGEAYLGFKNNIWNARVGNMLYTTPWANPSDSRVKPVFFEGADANLLLPNGFSVGLGRMIQWQSRTASNFNKSNNLPNSLYPDGSIKNPTTGFLLAKGGWQYGTEFNIAADYYYFYDVSSMFYLSGQYNPWPHSPLKPFIAGQFGSEQNTGTSTEGTISSTVGGLQLGASAGNVADVTVAWDSVPWNSRNIVSTSCSKAESASGVFLPTGGTPICQSLGSGVFRIFYGGLASPYTDSYATDPIYTTQISQGMVDRRSGGTSWKAASTFHLMHNQIRAIVSEGWYDYSNGAGANANTAEFNFDVTYFFNKVRPGTYHGLSLRERYVDRDIRNTQLYGGLPLFKYNRVQLEYDF